MRNSTEKQKGFVLVVVAGILIALIGFVPLGSIPVFFTVRGRPHRKRQMREPSQQHLPSL